MLLGVDLDYRRIAELEEVSEQHHAEMAEIRAGLLEGRSKLGDLRVYKRQANLAAMRRDWEAAAMWAERGIEAYGNDAAFPPNVEGLQKKLDKARSKLQ